MRKNMLRPLIRHFCTKGRDSIPPGGMYRSPWEIIKDEFHAVKAGDTVPEEPAVPREVDILVVGGGLIGSSVAYWMKHQHPKGFNVAVVERDMNYTRASSMLSAGGVRHQFSLPENVQLSMFCSEFLRDCKHHLSVLDEDPPQVQFNHQGYLFLVPPEKAELCVQNVVMQRELGAKIELLTLERLRQKFPWLNLDGVELGSYGLEGEGWFDPYSLVHAFKRKNLSLGVHYIAGEVTGFDYRQLQGIKDSRPHNQKVLESAIIKGNDGKTYNTRFAVVVNCAGCWAAEIARMAMIGEGPAELSVPLPVEARKRFIYSFHSPDGPGVASPFTIDSTSAYFRQDGYGGHYIGGGSPQLDEDEPSTGDLEVDYDYFQNHVWPCIAHRVPKFENLKLKSAWAGFYDYNTLDQNLIIGNHPYHRNMFFANGLSGHGVQHAIGIGRAIMELIIYNNYRAIDLDRFKFDRVLYDAPLIEQCIV